MSIIWDSVYICLADLQELEIKESFEENKQMSKNKFSNLLRMWIKKNALQYLKEKQRSKGTDVIYSNLNSQLNRNKDYPQLETE